MAYKAILWDIDGTLLNFIEAEKCALSACFEKFGLGPCTDEMIARYSVINKRHWEALERGEITKQEVLVGRYREFFAGEGIDTSFAEPVNAEYQVRLGDTCVFCDNGYELIRALRGNILQYAVTNGTSLAQERKLKNSGLDGLFDGVFISDKIGYEKPDVRFFDAVFDALTDELGPGGYKKDEILIVGDSLTSDIRGGSNAGIRTCWYNPAHAANTAGVHTDYEIVNLWEVRKLVEKLHVPERVLKDITVFAKKHDVKKIILFGSRARGTNGERSDIDIAVEGGEFDAFYWDTKEYTHSLLMFDIVELCDEMSAELKKEIDRDGVVIYEKA